MTSTEMEAFVRSVIVHRGLPFAIQSVLPAQDGWSIEVRGGNRGSFAFRVPSGRPVAMRVTIEEKLEAEL
jgi:hypothetical protein